MAVKPEEVLEEHRITAARWVEDPPLERVIEADQRQREAEHRGS